MDDYVEEDEIKIEYFESLETDPLCEKLEEKSFVTNDASVNNVSSITQDFEDQSNTDGDDAYKYDSNYCHNSSPICDTEQKLKIHANRESTNQINWYRDINESGKFVCQFCDLTYCTIQTIRHHVKTKHPEHAKALKNAIRHNRRAPKIRCHICKKIFKDISHLKNHIKEHFVESERKFCQVCLATFNNEQEMTEHLYLNHLDVRSIKIYSCSICGYQTKKLSHFKQHSNIHTQNKKLKCDSCDYATNYLPNLNIHQRIHTNYKPYICTFHGCNYRCSAKSALRSHQLKHNPGQNMLFCDKCTYKTVYKNSLKKHIESHKRNSLKLV